jgi:VWFA-related protein
MPPIYSARNSRFPRVSIAGTVALILALLFPGTLLAQGQPQAQPSPSPQQSPQTSTPEAGGPGGDIGPIAIPKKAPEEPKKEEAPRKPKTPEGMPQFSLHVNAPLVTVDVGVLTKDGQFIPGLKPENFRILEDGVPQKVTGFNQTQAPITAVMLVEFAKNFYQFEYDALNASYTFAQTLKKEDWIALISFDMKTHMLADFTQDKREIYEGLRSLQIPMSAETNIFDALYDTVDRLEGVEGRKYIILIASGKDTFSRKTLDQIYKKVQGSKDIAIYVVSTGQALRSWAESHGMMRYLCGLTSQDSCSVEWAQVDNQMRHFATMTGGKYWAPIFDAQFREIFADLGQTIRNQYSLAYHPSNSAQDGSFRKIKVELVAPDGGPLKIRNEKGKDVKYQIIAREGYRAKREVE